MKHPEQAYLNLVKEVLETGETKEDRTGIGTISKFGAQIKFDLKQGFPAVTTKKLAWKSMVSELLWFLEGSGDEFRLKEILHGSRASEKKTIWTDNLKAPYWTSKRVQRHAGDLGRIYGVQWRRWRKPLIRINKVVLQNHDQLIELINGIKQDPYSRRHIITAWNPGELDLMVLPPCHIMAQFHVNNNKELSCHMYQRSADLFLGVPFNIASYALLTHMIAQVCELQVGNLIISFGDCHIYLNHIDQVKEQLKRTPLKLPKLDLNPNIKEISKFTMEDINLIDYESHPSITADMAV
jgi:thymidylate synthase